MADIEQVLTGWLGSQFPDARLCTEAPADMAGAVPVVRVVRVGGGRLYVLDRPTVVVDTFHADRPSAKAYAARVEHALYWLLPGAGLGVTGVATISGPSYAPWDNTNVRRITATYQIYFKNP